jgi:hypothetical protein
VVAKTLEQAAPPLVASWLVAQPRPLALFVANDLWVIRTASGGQGRVTKFQPAATSPEYLVTTVLQATGLTHTAYRR